jgi:hypothetical protein
LFRFFKAEESRDHALFDDGLIINQKGVHIMKNIRLMFCYSVLFLLITAFAGCAATSTRGSTGDFVDDTVITTKVKALLAEDDFLKSFKISVETYKGTVQLSGFVNSQQAVDRAVKLTRSVQGVGAVKNDLIVK